MPVFDDYDDDDGLKRDDVGSVHFLRVVVAFPCVTHSQFFFSFCAKPKEIGSKSWTWMTMPDTKNRTEGKKQHSLPIIRFLHVLGGGVGGGSGAGTTPRGFG